MTSAVSCNIHFTRICNFECKFCFHTDRKDGSGAPNETELRRSIQYLIDCGVEKLNFSGGEPSLFYEIMIRLMVFAKQLNPLLVVSVISNGSMLTESRLDELKESGLDILGLDVHCATDEAAVRLGFGSHKHSRPISHIVDLCSHAKRIGLFVKINSTISRFNVDEDLTEIIRRINPDRFKIFQAFFIPGEMKDDPSISEIEFRRFVTRHKEHLPEFSDIIIPEARGVMEGSYVLLDESGLLLESGTNRQVTSRNIADLDIEDFGVLIGQIFKEDRFLQREGLYYRDLIHQ